MKRLQLFLITLVMCFTGVCAVKADNMILEYDGGTHEYNGSVFALIVNNRKLDSLPLPPIIFNDRSLVPIREIFEELGATVSYDNDERRVEVVYNGTYIRMYINDNTAYINGKKTAIPDKVVPKLISRLGGETKTMVPLRFISETVGISVDFSSEHEAILVNSPNYSFAEEEKPTATPKPSVKPVITDISYSLKDEKNIEVTVTADSAINDYSEFAIESPVRAVTDFAGAALAKEENISVNSQYITAIRTGDNGERARIVIDVNGKLSDFRTEKLSDNCVRIIAGVSGTTSSTPKPTETPVQTPKTTPSPVQTPSATPNPNYSAYPSSAKLIVIDSGHGGKDSGAVGTLDGRPILEKDLTLQIAKKTKEILENNGYTVELTRSDDRYLELTEPPAQANAQNAAVFVSIHINSADASEAYGTEVYYSTENNGDAYGTTSEVLAKNVLSRMLYNMQSKSRGVKNANHAVTRRCKMPAVLAEVGFISNEDELRKMCSDEYQYKTAQGIAEGIIKTLAEITMP